MQTKPAPHSASLEQGPVKQSSELMQTLPLPSSVDAVSMTGFLEGWGKGGLVTIDALEAEAVAAVGVGGAFVCEVADGVSSAG